MDKDVTMEIMLFLTSGMDMLLSSFILYLVAHLLMLEVTSNLTYILEAVQIGLIFRYMNTMGVQISSLRYKGENSGMMDAVKQLIIMVIQ